MVEMRRPNKRDLVMFEAGEKFSEAQAAQLLGMSREVSKLNGDVMALQDKAVAMCPIEIAPLVWKTIGNPDDKENANTEDGRVFNYWRGDGYKFFATIEMSNKVANVGGAMSRPVSPPELEGHDTLKAWCEAQYQKHCSLILKEMEGRTDD